MIYTSHILIGSAIGGVVNEPWLALGSGILSHHVVDSLPHLDPGTYFKSEKFFVPKFLIFLSADLTIGTLAFYYMWKYLGYSIPVLFGAVGAVLPDIIDNGPWRFIRKLPVFKQYHSFHSEYHITVVKRYWYWGLLTQVTLVALALFVMFYYSH